MSEEHAAEHDSSEEHHEESHQEHDEHESHHKHHKSLEDALNDVDLVILDVDGTLVDRDDAYYAFYKALAELHGVKIPSKAEMVAKYANKGHTEIIMDILPGVSEKEAKAYKEWFQSHPEYFKDYIRILPGTIEFLANLYAAGKKIAIMSNARRKETKINLEFITEKYNAKKGTGLGVSELFYKVVSADDVHEKKPDPAGIDVIVNRSGTPKDKAIYGGDERRDVAAAHAAGIKVIASMYHDPKIATVNPDYIVPGTYSLGALNIRRAA